MQTKYNPCSAFVLGANKNIYYNGVRKDIVSETVAQLRPWFKSGLIKAFL